MPKKQTRVELPNCLPIITKSMGNISVTEQRQEAKAFAERWQGKGYEKGETQKFWLELLRKVFGVESSEEHIEFEDPVKFEDKHHGFIDARIPATRVIIEQKELGADLTAPIRQSDGTWLRPYQQAKRYADALPNSQRPRWIVVCNFQTFHIYDLETPQSPPLVIELKNLAKEFHYLSFLVQIRSEKIQKEIDLSIAAGGIVGKLHDALLKCYVNPENEASLKSLNVLCVRLVFCLYAEKADIFGSRTMFHDYLASFEPERMRRALIDLFTVLDTKEEERDPYLEKSLAAFPYVNGGLFRDEHIEIPNFTAELKALLLDEACQFKWHKISPTIFGAVFESTLNPETRRQGGMHYTSIENIHKLIDPLFLDALHAEFQEICTMPIDGPKKRKKKQEAFSNFQHKLASLQFLDPAAGSGNFLTETYLSLRRLENEVLKERMYGGTDILFHELVEVSIEQFHGIEINDFAVSVAKCALWIAESQMLKETEDILHTPLEFLPLKTNANIIEGNALQLDWEKVAPKEKLNYIMGNPPFSGYSLQTKEQKADLLAVFLDANGKPYKKAGKLDYVAGWYYKTAKYLQGTEIRAALVSTNSITQGEQVAGLWKPLFEQFGVHIDFAHRTFRWDSESNSKAHVHCVIVGFSSAPNAMPKRIYAEKSFTEVKNINAYLMDAPDVFVESRTKPLCDVPSIHRGNQPTDGGNLILSEDERAELISKEPRAEKYIRRFMMGYEFLHNVKRYCLWLVDCPPNELHKMPLIMKRIEACREYRLKGGTDGRKLADRPALFRESMNPEHFIAVPIVSSERRRYIPMDYLDAKIIPGNKLFMIQDATLYHFGILTSNVHMAWMRAVAGRLKSDYSYSKDIVYNNFPWPNPTPKQKATIEATAQAILDARAQFPDASLADLYDPATMPPALTKAHQANDRAVMKAYGFSLKISEAECLAELFGMYERLTK